MLEERGIKEMEWRKLRFIGIVCTVVLIYIHWQSKSIYGGDAGDLVTAAWTVGVPHPPGYPLYTAIAAWLIGAIPFSSSAWRVSLLSSIPAALTVGFVYLILSEELPNEPLVAMVGALALAFAYPFWLYSEVPEVFSLYNFLVVLLLWLFIRWSKSRNNRYLYFFSLALGLSLSHHHTIVFIFPAFVVAYWKTKKSGFLPTRLIFQCLLFFFLGLTPYLYIPLAALHHPVINWDNPTTLGNFIRLITRADYGSFRSNAYAGETLVERFGSIVGFFRFVSADFGIQGILLALAGVLYLWRKKTVLFWFATTASICLLFFLFYAAFRLGIDFGVATFERFILVNYIFLAMFMAMGMAACTRGITHLLPVGKSAKKRHVLLLAVGLVFFFYPLGLYLRNQPKFSALATDLTAENLGQDILNTVEPNSMLLLGNDTSYFNTLYVKYVMGVRPDVRLLSSSGLVIPWYRQNIIYHYPEIILPNLDTKEEVGDFLAKNGKLAPIYANGSFNGPGIYSVPFGLLWRTYYHEATPSAEVVIGRNEEVWRSYHNPLGGALGVFKHAMLADTVRIYSVARQNVGYYIFLTLGHAKEALPYFLESIKLTPEDSDAWILAGRAAMAAGECDEAKGYLEKSVALSPDLSLPYLYLGEVWSNRLHDANKAAEVKKIYEEKKRQRETPLKSL